MKNLISVDYCGPFSQSTMISNLNFSGTIENVIIESEKVEICVLEQRPKCLHSPLKTPKGMINKYNSQQSKEFNKYGL